jgi:hypothetical protein
MLINRWRPHFFKFLSMAPTGIKRGKRHAAKARAACTRMGDTIHANDGASGAVSR